MGINLTNIELNFRINYPHKPFQQLLSVLPPSSSNLIPIFYRNFFNVFESSMINFYPSSFIVDMNGKRFVWQGSSLIPFINESHLIHESEKIRWNHTGNDKIRNSRNLEALYICDRMNPLFTRILERNKNIHQMKHHEKK